MLSSQTHPSTHKKEEEEEKSESQWTDDAERGLKNRIEACAIVRKEGNALFEQKDYEGALKKYERAGQFLGVLFKNDKEHSDPIRLTLELNVAACYLKMKKYDEAIEHCNNALSIDSKNIKAFYRIGLCHAERGQYEKAESFFKKALTINPDNRSILLQLRKVRQAIKDRNREQGEMFKGVFNKAEIYSEKKHVSSAPETGKSHTSNFNDSEGVGMSKPESSTTNSSASSSSSKKHSQKQATSQNGKEGNDAVKKEQKAFLIDKSLYPPIIIALILLLALVAVTVANMLKYSA